MDNSRENRKKFRQMLFEAKGLGQYISGCILFEETLYEKKADGTSFVQLLANEGIVTGIKVDKGQALIMGAAPLETSTEGLDGLAKRCQEYYKAGARFAKWRAVIVIDAASGAPTQLAIDEQTRGLARYASICQENGLCPIVEPEVLMDGTHSIEVSADVTERVWHSQIKALYDHHLLMEGLLLKPNMVRSGAEAAHQASMAEVAVHTLRVLQRTIPPAIPGVTFLSGGMSEEEATVALNELNRVPGKRPWNLSFSYGRALQATVLKVWKGQDANWAAAQESLLVRARANSMAQQGMYDGFAKDFGEASKSTYQKNYTY